MSTIGPDLPPHLLAKRKRQEEDDAEGAPAANSGAKRSPSPEGLEKRRKLMGPAMPPAPLDERPEEPAHPVEDESSDDDDFGPALPAAGGISQAHNEDEGAGHGHNNTTPKKDKLRRDDWMMMPPKQDDLAARMDPTKQRPTKFNTGKGARGASSVGDDSSTWHETPEQKRKRLENEMMGIKGPVSTVKADPERSSRRAKDEAAHRKILEHNETRGPSLIEQHRQSKGAEAEDDPSIRAFDREKDMASGSRISSSNKREMLTKAAGFSDKFSGGTYL